MNDELETLEWTARFAANVLIVLTVAWLVVFFVWWKAEDNGVALVGVVFNICALIYSIYNRVNVSRL